LFHISESSAFADDSYIPRTHINTASLIVDLEKSLEAITKWLKQSDPKVNQEKTELCLFYKSDTTPIEICMGNNTIISKKERNVFGVTFDPK
jgi:hypothetical protein